MLMAVAHDQARIRESALKLLADVVSPEDYKRPPVKHDAQR